MTANKIKFFREQKGLTQSDLAERLEITRSSVNAWEMGLSTPSTPYLLEMSRIFGVSLDYILGLSTDACIKTEGLSDEDIKLVYKIIDHLKHK